MALIRGFKAEANRIAALIRGEIGLSCIDPLNPHELAKHLEIPIFPLSKISNNNLDYKKYFSQINPDEFSAVTIFEGSMRIILHNDSHISGRQASNLTHEIAHSLLFHEPQKVTGPTGFLTDWDKNQEQEAEWLMGNLLVTDEAAIHIVQNGINSKMAACTYGVNPKLMEFRIKTSGAFKRAKRLKSKCLPWNF